MAAPLYVRTLAGKLLAKVKEAKKNGQVGITVPADPSIENHYHYEVMEYVSSGGYTAIYNQPHKCYKIW